MRCCSPPVIEYAACRAWLPYDCVSAFDNEQSSEAVGSAACHATVLKPCSFSKERGKTRLEARRS